MFTRDGIPCGLFVQQEGRHLCVNMQEHHASWVSTANVTVMGLNLELLRKARFLEHMVLNPTDGLGIPQTFLGKLSWSSLAPAEILQSGAAHLEVA